MEGPPEKDAQAASACFEVLLRSWKASCIFWVHFMKLLSSEPLEPLHVLLCVRKQEVTTMCTCSRESVCTHGVLRVCNAGTVKPGPWYHLLGYVVPTGLLQLQASLELDRVLPIALDLPVDETCVSARTEQALLQ